MRDRIQTTWTRLRTERLQDESWFETISPLKQVPVIDDDGYILTESGAILLYVAEKSGKLIPRDLQGCAQVYRWLITSLNNIELRPAICDEKKFDCSKTGHI